MAADEHEDAPKTRHERAKMRLRLIDDMAAGILSCFEGLAKEYPGIEVMDLAHLPHTRLLQVVAKLRKLVDAESMLDGTPPRRTDN